MGVILSLHPSECENSRRKGPVQAPVKAIAQLARPAGPGTGGGAAALAARPAEPDRQMRKTFLPPLILAATLPLAACWDDEDPADTAAETEATTPVAADEAARKIDEAAAKASAALEARRTESEEGRSRSEIQTLLTPEGFDAERVRRLIETSDRIDEAERTFLLNSLDQIAEDPALLDAFLDRLRAAMAG